MSLFIVFLVGFMLFTFGIYSLSKHSPAKWQQVPAVVTGSNAKEHPARYSRVYTPGVSYRYEVDGSIYCGDTYAFSSEEDAGSLEVITAVLQREFEAGTTIAVWCQINRPAVSCIKLNSAYSRNHMAALVVSGVLVWIVGIAVILIENS
jgi:hypothetical protein